MSYGEEPGGSCRCTKGATLRKRRGETRQIKWHSIYLLSFRAFLQNGLFCGGSLLLRLHFPRLPLLPTLEPGAGSSQPGNVRRQEPPRRRQLGHPIRRKSESSSAMAGPAANEPHLLRPPPLLFRRYFPADPGSVRLSSPLHPSPSGPNATGRREVEARHGPRVRPCSPLLLLLPLVLLGGVRTCTCVRVTDTPDGGFRDARAADTHVTHQGGNNLDSKIDKK